MCGEKAQERLREVILERRKRARRLEVEIESRREEIAVREEELEMLAEATEADKEALQELSVEMARETREPLAARKPAPSEHKERTFVTKEQVRDVMVELGEFATWQVAELLDVSTVTARRYIDEYVEDGMAVDTDRKMAPRGGKGRQSIVFRWTGKQGAADPKNRPVVREQVPRGVRFSGPQNGNGNGNGVGKIANRDIRRIVDERTADGWEAKRTGSGHIALAKKGVGQVSLGNTPSDHRAVKNAEKQLERLERQAEADLVPA